MKVLCHWSQYGLSQVDLLFLASYKNKIWSVIFMQFTSAHQYAHLHLIYLQIFLLAFKISCFSKLASPSRFLLGLNEMKQVS